MSKNNKHILGNQLSNFFLSKRSLKAFYLMNPYFERVLRYIADSMDKNYCKYQKFETSLSNPQIATYCNMSDKQVRRAIEFLIKKRFLKKPSKSWNYSIGRVLSGLLDRTLRCRSNRPEVRCRSNRPTSVSSVISNNNHATHSKNKIESGYNNVEEQSTSFKRLPEVERTPMPKELRAKIKRLNIDQTDLGV